MSESLKGAVIGEEKLPPQIFPSVPRPDPSKATPMTARLEIPFSARQETMWA